MKKIDNTLVVYRVLFLCLIMQLATIPQAVAVNSLPDPFPLSIGHAESGLSVLFQDSIGLKLDEEASLLLVPSEFPAVAKVSDMADEHWPQLIADESVHSDTGGVRSVFRWANQRIPDSLIDDPLLRFLAFIHGAAFQVQDSHGQLSYIIQHNGKLSVISKAEAFLRFSQYHQSFLESLYPEIFGPSLPAGGGWHEWNRFVRKMPFHPNESSGEDRSSGQVRASTERDGKQEATNQQKVEAVYDYGPLENGDEKAIPLYATAFLNRSQQHLYCPVCTELISGEAKACNSNPPHSLCIDCFESIARVSVGNIVKCATCRGEMHHDLFNYEDAAATVMFQCPFGCNHDCPLAFMKNHIKEHYLDVTLEKCRICLQQVDSATLGMHRESCLPNVCLDQDYAFFYERIKQESIQLYGEQDGKGIISVYKVPEEETYYCKISKLFYESITRGGRRQTHQLIKFIANSPDDFENFSVDFIFDGSSSSLGFMIYPIKQQSGEHRRMALPIIFNEKGEKLLNKSFLLTGSSWCSDCGCEVTRGTFTHPNPYPICINGLIYNFLCSEDRVRHNNDFPECIYVQIKLTPVVR